MDTSTKKVIIKDAKNQVITEMTGEEFEKTFRSIQKHNGCEFIHEIGCDTMFLFIRQDYDGHEDWTFTRTIIISLYGVPVTDLVSENQDRQWKLKQPTQTPIK